MTAPSIDARQAQPPNTPKVRNATPKPCLAGVRQSPDVVPFPLPAFPFDKIERHAFESQAFESHANDRALNSTSCCATRSAPSALPPLLERVTRRANSF